MIPCVFGGSSKISYPLYEVDMGFTHSTLWFCKSDFLINPLLALENESI